MLRPIVREAKETVVQKAEKDGEVYFLSRGAITASHQMYIDLANPVVGVVADGLLLPVERIGEPTMNATNTSISSRLTGCQVRQAFRFLSDEKSKVGCQVLTIVRAEKQSL